MKRITLSDYSQALYTIDEGKEILPFVCPSCGFLVDVDFDDCFDPDNNTVYIECKNPDPFPSPFGCGSEWCDCYTFDHSSVESMEEEEDYCPYCESEEITNTGNSFEDPYIEKYYECDDCGKKWTIYLTFEEKDKN